MWTQYVKVVNVVCSHGGFYFSAISCMNVESQWRWMNGPEEESCSAFLSFSESANVTDWNVPCVRLCVWSGQTLTICTHTPTISLLSKHNLYTHTPAHRAVGLPLVTLSGVTVHSGWWLTQANLFIFLPRLIITRTKYHLLAFTVYSGNNTLLMSGQTHCLSRRAWKGGGWNDVRSAGVVTEHGREKIAFVLW